MCDKIPQQLRRLMADNSDQGGDDAGHGVYSVRGGVRVATASGATAAANPARARHVDYMGRRLWNAPATAPSHQLVTRLCTFVDLAGSRRRDHVKRQWWLCRRRLWP